MLSKIFIKKNLIIAFSAIVLLGLIGFVEKKTADKTVKHVNIYIHDDYGNHFVDEGDVIRLLAEHAYDSLRGREYRTLNLKNMEDRVKKNKFVEDAEIYKDHKGNLIVEVTQFRPIARIVQADGPHAYIGEKGNILPVSDKFTSRVVVVDGPRSARFLDSSYRVSQEAMLLVKLLNMIDADPFLRAQVSQITLKPNGELLFYPQVGSEVVEFGRPDDMEIKLKKFKIFYKKILQLKGFNKYRTVNLKYKDQIICE